MPQKKKQQHHETHKIEPVIPPDEQTNQGPSTPRVEPTVVRRPPPPAPAAPAAPQPTAPAQPRDLTAPISTPFNMAKIVDLIKAFRDGNVLGGGTLPAGGTILAWHCGEAAALRVLDILQPPEIQTGMEQMPTSLRLFRYTLIEGVEFRIYFDKMLHPDEIRVEPIGYEGPSPIPP